MKNSIQDEIIQTSFVSAIICCGGNSTRMGKDINKLLMHLLGIPVIARTLMKFEESSYINEIIIVCREEDIITYWDIVRTFDIFKVKSIIKGGSTRQNSVLNGINEASLDCEFYVIHDGARPLVDTNDIDNVIQKAFKTKAAALGIKFKDTVKRTDTENKILETVDRNTLWCVQTPQVFKKDLYLQARKIAAENNQDFTDDCALIENILGDVYICEGKYSNIKITTKEDIHIAESFMLEDDKKME